MYDSNVAEREAVRTFVVYHVVGHVCTVNSLLLGLNTLKEMGRDSQPRPYKALVGCNTHGNCTSVTFSMRAPLPELASSSSGSNVLEDPTHPGPDVHILSNTLHPRSLVKVSGRDALSDDIPIRPNRQQLHLLLLHDILQLSTDFTGLAHELGVEEVLHAPVVAVSVLYQQTFFSGLGPSNLDTLRHSYS